MLSTIRHTRTLTTHSPMKIRALIADWDDTITDDTIHLVAQAAYEARPDFPVPWSEFRRTYKESYDRYLQFPHKRDTLTDERIFQNGMKDVELSSVRHYTQLKLFEGVQTEQLAKQAEKVVVKPGAMECLRLLIQQGVPVYILSVNWTSIIMKKVLENNGIVVDNNKVRIYTNEFEEIDGVLTGGIKSGPDIRTAVDKEEVFVRIRNELGFEDGVWYVGDSTTDIICLLHADTGVVVEGGSALGTLSRLKVPFSPNLQGPDKIKCIKSWYEILEVLKTEGST